MLYGKVMAENRDSYVKAEDWAAVVRQRGGTPEVGAVFLDDDEVYRGGACGPLVVNTLSDFMREVFEACAVAVAGVEKATSRLPYNNPKRDRLYWAPLNAKAKEIRSTKGVSAAGLELIVQLSVKGVWKTVEPKHVEACRLMGRRKYTGGRGSVASA
jgi:hypothetical protein